MIVHFKGCFALLLTGALESEQGLPNLGVSSSNKLAASGLVEIPSSKDNQTVRTRRGRTCSSKKKEMLGVCVCVCKELFLRIHTQRCLK